MCQIDVYRARVVRVGYSYVDRLGSSVFSRGKRVQADIVPQVVIDIDIHKMGPGLRLKLLV